MPTHVLTTAASVLVLAGTLLAATGNTRAHGTAAGQQHAPLHGQPATPSIAHQRKHTLLEADRHAAQALPALAATPCIDGFAATWPCDGVDLLSFMPLAQLGGASGNDVWGWTDPETGKEYAIMGLNNGTAFIDISNPVAPVLIGRLPTHSGTSLWRDIKTYAGHAYIVSEAAGHGLQIFDLSLLRAVTAPPATFTETAHYAGFSTAHNVVVNEDSGFAYAVGTDGCSGGLHMVDILNPVEPAFAGCFDADGDSHDAQCVSYRGPDVDHQGKEICFNSNGDALTVVDVSNKAAPLLLSRTTYPGLGYVHQGWLTEDHVHFLVDDELDELGQGHNTRTRIFDVSDLDAPALVGFHDGRTGATDHNQYAVGATLYQANYRAGLTLLDLDDVQHGVLTELGFFDVYPGSDSPNFNGAWSVYPFFASGTIVVSGIEQGLFVLKQAAASTPTIGIRGQPDPAGVGEPFNLSWSLANPGETFDAFVFLGVFVNDTLLPLATVPVQIPAGVEFTDAALTSFPYPDLPLAAWVIGLFDAGTGAQLHVDVDIVAAPAGGTSSGSGAGP